MSRKKIAIIEDDNLLRRDYAALINHTDDLECLNTHQFSCCEDAIPILKKEHGISLVLQDIGMPDGKMNGIQSLIQTKKRNPELVVVMLTIYDQDEYLFDALKAGADGYVLKTETDQQVLFHLRNALQGGSPMSKVIAKKVLQSFRRETTRTRSQKLSPFQERILQTIAQEENLTGSVLSNAELIEKLGKKLTPSELAREINRIYQILQVNNRREMIKKYQESWWPFS
jgi:DNA-binding NarL/FixJ family response regulator